jgi:hypothetical protein
MSASGRILSAVIACALVCACDQSPPAAEQPASGPARPAAEKAPVLPPEMVAAVSASRSSLLIGVHFTLGASPAVDKPLPVDIAVLPHQGFAKVNVHFTSQEGLRLVTGAEMPAQPGPAGKVLKHQLTLVPSRDGIFMVTAAVETESEEGTITRVYSIPVIVAGPAPAPTG